MKRYVCTVATGLLLALVGTSSATAGLPLLGSSQQGTQSTGFGDQTVEKQKNDAVVTQEQGNGNLNIAPAIAIFGAASTKNAQGNGNTANADVEQGNTMDQSQSGAQSQDLGQSGGGCCSGQSQTGEQSTSFGNQHVGEQSNEADVSQEQGNDNVNIAPAIAVFGDASTSNHQGNGNSADASVTQQNDASQSQSSNQSQSLEQGAKGCCGGQSQTGRQSADFGDQTVEKQKNDAVVTQEQGNGNLNIAPAIAIFGAASTKNAQGNGNTANADVEQSNDVRQSQSASQSQKQTQDGGSCCKQPTRCGEPGYGGPTTHTRKDACKPHDPPRSVCCVGQSQTGEQSAHFGDQTVGEQTNHANVTQKQGSGNVNFAPALGIGGGKSSCSSKCERKSPCSSKCGGGKPAHGGDASTWNAQGNGNNAQANVDQANSASQSQQASQRQSLVQACKELIAR